MVTTDDEGGDEESDVDDTDASETISKDDLDRKELTQFKRIQNVLGDDLIDLKTDYEMGLIEVNPDNEIAQMIRDGEEEKDIIKYMKTLGSNDFENDDDEDEDGDSYGPNDDEENPNDDFDLSGLMGDSFKMKLDKIKSKILQETSQHQKIV